jgi:ABC-2 type transport system permease protein
MNWKRIAVLLKKDVNENWAVLLLVISIPLLVYFVFHLVGSEEITVGVCGELPPDFPFEATHYTAEEGIIAVKRGDIAAFYISEKEILYGNRAMKERVEAIAWLLSPSIGMEEIPVNSIDPFYLIFPLLLSIVIYMGGIIGVPVVIGSEKSSKTLEALILTPLTYTEFVMEKSIFGFFSIFLASVVFLLISQACIGNYVGTLVLLALGALLFSLVAVMITTPFSTIESLMAVATPVFVIIIFVESISMLSSYSLPLPISTGIYRSMILGTFPLVEALVLVLLILITIYIDSEILRRTLRRE